MLQIEYSEKATEQLNEIIENPNDKSYTKKRLQQISKQITLFWVNGALKIPL